MRRMQGVDMDTVIYYQDRATPHCSNVSLECLHRYFIGVGFIFHRPEHPLPAHCPILSPVLCFSVGIPKRQDLR